MKDGERGWSNLWDEWAPLEWGVCLVSVLYHAWLCMYSMNSYSCPKHGTIEGDWLTSDYSMFFILLKPLQDWPNTLFVFANIAVPDFSWDQGIPEIFSSLSKLEASEVESMHLRFGLWLGHGIWMDILYNMLQWRNMEALHIWICLFCHFFFSPWHRVSFTIYHAENIVLLSRWALFLDNQTTYHYRKEWGLQREDLQWPLTLCWVPCHCPLEISRPWTWVTIRCLAQFRAPCAQCLSWGVTRWDFFLSSSRWWMMMNCDCQT